MRIVVLGAGALGGYYGGVLARSGADVTFLARGATLDALRIRGLEVRSLLSGNFSQTVNAVGESVELEPPDLILLSAKTYDLDSAATTIAPLVGQHTSVLTMQNGIDHIDRLSAYMPRERIVPAVVYISSTVVEPGVIDQVGGSGQIILGEDSGGVSSRIDEIGAVLASAGIPIEKTNDIWLKLWTKFMVICAMSGVSALTRLTLQEIFDVPESRMLYRDVMAEVASVARAAGAGLPASAADDALRSILDMPSRPQRGSMAYDLLGGRRLELDSLNGAVVRLGDQLGVPVPMNRAIYHALKPFVAGTPTSAR